MDGLNDGFADSALTRLFVGEQRSPDVSVFTLPGGRILFAAGEPAENLYFVRTGRLGAVKREEGHDQQFLGVIKPGEPVGEMSLVAGTPHSATVLALRDSELFSLPRASFLAEAHRRPELMTELARLMILRVRETGARTAAGDPTVFGFVGVAGGVEVRRLVEHVERHMTGFGQAVTVVGAEAAGAPTEWFSTVEQRHDYVLYVAEHDQTAWAEQCGRQVDRLFLVGRGGSAPPEKPSAFAAEAMRQHRLMDLVLLHEPETVEPRGSEAWLTAAPATRLFHLRRGDEADAARMARTLTGRSVGLVLSGGAARAYAHVGAIRALRETGTPIDFVGGTSMGAIIGAGVAIGWDDAELDRRIRQAFVDSSPVADIAFPMIAMTHGHRVRRRLHEHFGDRDIADLWRPYFCISSNLTSGQHQVHRRGRLAHALEASSALPGVLPPVIVGDDVLVDGALLRNFPTDVMKAWNRGPIVGVDVSRSRGLTADEIVPPASILRWFLSGDFMKGPPIVSLLMRAATVSTDRELAAAREAAEVLVMPRVEEIEIRDWRQGYAPAVTAGHEAMVAALKGLAPVPELRRLKLAQLAAAGGAVPG
ncbi:MAG TPA: patatin-like phospholipase family protein [Caulobacteraceae bacterium]|jgi:NTE family protein|nr:patatin-like phospholipase family protein [Caulobacteraceae bacterium]